MTLLRDLLARLSAPALFLPALMLTLLVSASPLRAQPAAGEVSPFNSLDAPPPPGVSPMLDSARAARGARLDIWLVTFGPGKAVFERFGHNAIVVTDTVSGQSFAYNWGMFDFNQPNFIGRFLSGNTRYWLGVFRTDDMLAAYRRENRSIRIQKLAFNAIQKGALFDYVQWNSSGDNIWYRYDYYRDNCSTRVRDLLDHVLNGQLQRLLSIPGEGRTYREETARILADNLPAYAGIEMALGRRADEPLSLWEEAFLPEHLADHISNLGVLQPGGRAVRLVSSDSLIFEAVRRSPPHEEPEWTSMAILLGLLFAGLCALLADARNRFARIALCSGVAIWYGVSGVVGTALLLAATVTRHAPYMGDNTTLLVANPLALVAMVAVPAALWKKRRSPAATGVATTIAVFSVAALMMRFIPTFTQHNETVLAVMVPVNLVLAVAAVRLRVVRSPG